MFSIHCKYSISHLLIDVHLYKFFTCSDINKICLKQTSVFQASVVEDQPYPVTSLSFKAKCVAELNVCNVGV